MSKLWSTIVRECCCRTLIICQSLIFLTPSWYPRLHREQAVNHPETSQYVYNPVSNRRTERRKLVRNKAKKKLARKQKLLNDANSNLEETEGADDESDKLEFVIDEGFMKFLEISMEHKANRKRQLAGEKQRAALKAEADAARNPILMGEIHNQKKQFKRNLYGKESDKIMAMEKAMDINLAKNKDLYKPILWPNIALNLKFD